MIARVSKLLRMAQTTNEDGGLLFASGATVPADTTAGYRTGCIFQHTDGGSGTAFYINEGSVTSSAFAAVAGLTAAQEALLSATAGTAAASKAVILDASKNIAGINSIELVQGAPAAITDGNTAITAANLQNKILTMASSTSGRAPTVPTGTAVNAIVAIGDSIDWFFLNTGNQTVTISVATGHTLVGTMALATVTQGHFRTRVSAANTAITYRIA